MAVVWRSICIAVHLASIWDAVPITIGLAVVRNAVGITVVAVDFTFIWNRIAIAILERFALIGLTIAIAIRQVFAIIRKTISIAVNDGARVHVAGATLEPRTTNASTESVSDIIKAQSAFVVGTRKATSTTWGA